MLIEFGLLATTYLGAKFFASSKSKKNQLKKIKAEFEADQKAKLLGNGKKIEDEENLADEPQDHSPTEKEQERFFKVATASMGLFAFKSLIPGAIPLGFAAYLYSAIPYMKSVENSLVREKKVNVDVLFFFADALTLGSGSYFTAAFGLSLIHSGKYMVAKVKDDSAKMVKHLFKELPRSVYVLIDGVEVELALDEVKANDILVINSGEVIPVDGVVHQGVAQIDQQALTGEAQPVEKGEGDSVFANTIVMAGKMQIRVNRSGEETTSAQIANMLFNSVSFKSGVQLKGERWADQMTKPMLLLSAASLPFIGAVSTSVLINSHIGVRIKFFAPLATLRHISEASRLGVLVKDGRALEYLGKVDTILFDKTGTLTTDQPVVKKITPQSSYTTKEVLAYAATAEKKLAHPIAKAILQKAVEEEVALYEVQDSSYKLGYGISVEIGDKMIRVGSLRFLQGEGVSISKEVLQAQEESHAVGNTFILIGIDQEVGGTLELEPQIRPEIEVMIAQLRAFGVDHMGIVSGDHQSPTRKLAEELGMDEYFYDVLPENKSQIVEQLQAKGRVVCFIGDGINDSIALKKANVSISIAGATSIAKDMAEIVFMDGTLSNLVGLVEISKRLDVNLQRSLILCIVPGLINLSGAFLLNFNVLAALLVNSGAGFVGLTNLFETKKKLFPLTPQISSSKIIPVDGTDQLSSEPSSETKEMGV